MIWHSNDVESIVKELGTSLSQGLSSEEAETRFKRIKSKIKKREEKKSYISFLLDEIKIPAYYFSIIIALVAFAFYFIFDALSLFEPIVLFTLTIIKALLTAFTKMHYHYEIDRGTTEEKSTIRVLRDGEAITVDSDTLVPGDVIFISEGDYVPADARLVRESDLHCDEYNITGETVPTQKSVSSILQDITPTEERCNMIFAASHVLSGSGVAVVTEVLDYTEYQKRLFSRQEDNSYSLSLEQRLMQLSKLLNTVMTGVTVVLFLISFIVTALTSNGNPLLLNSFLSAAFLAASVGMALMPSAINILVVACISRGIRRMKSKGISLFNPQTVEAISKLDVICADKTGTFTQNKMVLTQMCDGYELINVKKDTIVGEFKMLLRLAALCCDGEVKLINGIPVETGDSTQTAIISASMEHLGLSKYDLDNIYPRMAEIPFNSDRKLMTTVNIIDGQTYVIVRGSADMLYEKCSNDCQYFKDAAEDMSNRNLRVVGVAMKQIDEYSADLTPEEIERDLKFVGLLGLSDMPRLDSKEAVKQCQKAGMKVVMLTGDHPNAAFATAQKLRIARTEDQIASAEELQELEDDELCAVIERFTVFAGVTAEDRNRIIKALKDAGHNVATTGDSIMNAQALRTADVGYSMGKSGSDVAICSSEVVIEDDSFASVVTSVKDCRGIYHNISKSIKFFLSCSLGMILSLLLGCLLFRTPTPILSSAQVIITSVISILLMSLGMAYEDSEKKDINLIIDNDAEIFKSNFLFDIIFNAIIFSISLIASYAIAAQTESILSTSSFTFVTAVFTFLLSGLTLKRENVIISLKLCNRRAYIFSGVAFIITLIITLFSLFGVTSFGVLYWLYAVIIAVATTLTLNIIKFIRR